MAKCKKSNTTEVAKQNTEDGKLPGGFSPMGHRFPGATLVRMKSHLHADMTLIVAVYSANWHQNPLARKNHAKCESLHRSQISKDL